MNYFGKKIFTEEHYELLLEYMICNMLFQKYGRQSAFMTNTGERLRRTKARLKSLKDLRGGL